MRATLIAALLLPAVCASAQQSIFDPDDFIDPRQRTVAVFASRLIVGGGWNLIDGYRPLHQNGLLIHVANSFYWKTFELDYKHTQVEAKNDGPAHVLMCPCNPTVYIPNSPPDDAPPAAPLPAPRETLQFAHYYEQRSGGAAMPIMLRVRLSWSRQKADAIVTSIETGHKERRSGHDQTFTLDTDTHFRIRDHDIFGTVFVARTMFSGPTQHRLQNDIVYVSRPSGVELPRRILLRGTFAVGGITGRGGTALNLLNPAAEAFWHSRKTDANLHVVWSAQRTRSRALGWETHHQIAAYIDWGYLHFFSSD